MNKSSIKIKDAKPEESCGVARPDAAGVDGGRDSVALPCSAASIPRRGGRPRFPCVEGVCVVGVGVEGVLDSPTLR